MKQIVSLVVILAALVGTTFSQTVSTGQTIVAAEYFRGADPGLGKGTAISATFGSASVEVSLTATASESLPLFVRFKSSDGAWSAPYPVTGNSSSSGATLSAAEYFVNTDPGLGNGTSSPVGSNGRIDVSSPPLSRGDTLYLRVKDSFGRWSPPRAVRYDFRNILAAQYYIKYANGTVASTTAMSLTDSIPDYPVFVATSASIPTLTSGDTVYVRVQSDNSFWSQWTASPGVVTEIKENNTDIPGTFKLYQAYPNPFNPTTVIMYDLPRKSYVYLAIYDILGREVRILVSGDKPAGTHRLTFNAGALPSGVYFYRLTAGTFAQTDKFVLIK